MTPELMRELIKRKPFIPVRLHLTDGDTVDVRFPELTLVTHHDMFVGWKDPASKRRIASDGVLLGWPAIESYELLPVAENAAERG
jgi:hypothetical protein